eukprot:414973_1
MLTFISNYIMTEVTEPKITPPMNHSIEKHKLKVGDHIYRRLDSIGGVFGDHHGIVIEVNGNDIKVIEMTDKGIGINSLSGFLNNHTCRKVYYNYNTTKFYQTIQRPGTCHTEKASPINRVLKRIKKVKKLMKCGKLENPKTYCLFGANCEEFATWIKTGLYKGTKMSQLKGGKRICEIIWNPSKEAGNAAATNGITCALKKVAMVAVTSVDDLASTALSSTKSAVNSVGKTAATEIVENSAKIAARGIGAGVGIAVGLEIIISIGRVVKYKKDYKYTKCDLWRDLGRSWITTIVCAAIGVSSLAIGWWAILPAAGAGLLLTLLFRYFNVFDRKSHKEKVYKEYKLN